MTLWVRIADDLTGSAKKRNYNWAVFTADTPGAHDGLAQGVVKGYQLAKGWKKLLKKVTNAAMKVPEKEQLGLPYGTCFRNTLLIPEKEQELQDPDEFFAPELDFTPEHATA